MSPSKRIAGLVGPTLIAVTISETVISTSGRPTTPRQHIILYMRGVGLWEGAGGTGKMGGQPGRGRGETHGNRASGAARLKRREDEA